MKLALLWVGLFQFQAHRAHRLLLALDQGELVEVAVALVLQHFKLIVVAGDEAAVVAEVAFH